MKLIDQEIICPICGNKHDYRGVASLYIYDKFLDGQPVGYSLTLGIDECPNCHYVSNGDGSPVRDEIKNIVLSKEYQENALSKDEEHEYFMLKEMFELHKKRIKHLYWFKKEHNLECQDLLEEIINKMKEDIESETADEDSYMHYIDFLRQGSRFEESLEALDAISVEVPEGEEWDHFRELINFERELISNKDTKR